MTEPGAADLVVSGDGAHREGSPRSRWFFHSSAIKVAGAALLLLVLWSFTPPSEPRYRLCGFYWLTGRSCPLCGLTRAVFALAKGNIRQAVGFNALSPLGFAMLFCQVDRPAMAGKDAGAAGAKVALGRTVKA